MASRASNLIARFATALVGLPIVIGVLYAAPPWGFFLLVLPAALFALYELLSMTHPHDPVARAIGVLVGAALSFSLYGYTWALRTPVVLSVLLVVPLVGPLVTLVRLGEIETVALRACALGFAPLFVVVPLTLLPIMRLWLGREGAGLVLLALGVAWFADTGAYFAGRWLGRHKLYPAVSPNKTVEGAIGGLVASVVWSVAASMSYLHGSLGLGAAVALGVVAGALGQAGDLAESAIKRSTGVKDSGAILPGHGGVLDRVDAVLVTTVVVFLYMTWTH